MFYTCANFPGVYFKNKKSFNKMIYVASTIGPEYLVNQITGTPRSGWVEIDLQNLVKELKEQA